MGEFNKIKSDVVVEWYNNRSIKECNVIFPDGTKIERCQLRKKQSNGKSDYVSTSKIESFCSCPRCYYLTHVEQSINTSSIFTQRGTYAHKLMEDYVNHYIEFKQVKPVEEFDSFSESDLTDFKDMNEVHEMVKGFCESCPVDKWVFTPFVTEKEFVLDIDGVTLSGIIDVIGVDKNDPECLVIADYKTNYLNWTAEDLANSLQFHIYSMVCRELFPQYKKIKCMYFMLRTNTVQICPSYSNEELDRTRSYIIAMDKKISQSDFQPTLNTYCCYRDCRHNCEVYQDAVIKGIAITPKDLLEQRDFYYSIEKNSSSLRKECDRNLKEIINKEGTIIKDGYQYSINNIKKTGLDYKKLEKVLIGHNRLDLLNGFVQIKDEERFLLLVQNLDDLMLKLDILQCTVNMYSAKAISRKKITK